MRKYKLKFFISFSILTCVLIQFALFSCAQGLYMPRDVKKALVKNTRSLNGSPGSRYWQNTAKYKIDVSVMPPDRTIKGTEAITYFNNSPDTLKQITFKLFLNIHKPGASRDGSTTDDYLTPGITIDHFSLNGKSEKWENQDVFTVKTIALKMPLLPHDSLHLAFDWHYLISLRSNREGMIDSTTYFLAYFYPRVAVYDDYSGWDKIPFLDSKEFYSDFNDYNISLHVPKDYIVLGTGTLQKPESVLQAKFASRLNQSMHSDSVIHIAHVDELKQKVVTIQNPVNSWQFNASQIPDMAFAVSNHFNWDASSVIVDTLSKRRSSVQSAYDNKAPDYPHMVDYAKHALEWLSKNWPGIPYPYEKMTVVQGFAGMEYPMMANDESDRDTVFARFVAEHEIAHTYMPFYMGINETKYGFMDEGWATTFELLIGRSDLGTPKAEELYKGFRVEHWIKDPSADQDLPIITPGSSMTGKGLGNNEYGKASLAYLAMKDLLGDALFKKCLHEYMHRWHGKHPIPWDFFYTFNTISGKNLNWFWDNWFFSNHYIDFSIKSVKQNKQGILVSIGNVGGFPAPFDLIISYEDGTQSIIHKTPAIWEHDNQVATVFISTMKKFKSLKLDGGIFMDANYLDNEYIHSAIPIH